MAETTQPVELTDDEFMRLQGFVPDEAPSEAPPGFVEVDPLDDMTDDELIREREGFNPVQYYNEHGEGAMDAAKLARLKKIFNARLQEGVSAGGLAGAAGRTVKGVVTGIPHMLRGLGEAAERVARPIIAAGGVMPLAAAKTAQSAARVISGETEKDATRDIVNDWVDTGIAELFGGVEGEAVGLGEAVMTGIDKAKVAVKGNGLTDDEAGKILSDWAARTKQAEQVSAGKGATFNVVDAAKKIGVEVDPEAVQSIAAGAPLSLVAVGGVFKLVNQAGKAILTAPSKTAAMQTYKSVQKQLASAQQALKAAPTAEREAALQTAVTAAETTPRPLLAAVSEAIPSAETVAGRALQATGAVTESAVAPTMRLGARALRATRPLGIPVGSIVGVPLQAAAEVVRRAGAGARALGAEVAGEAPGVAAQRVQDIVRATQNVAVGTGVGTAIDTGFALGTSKTDEEARNMPGIGGALGLGVGLARGGRAIITGEQLAPRKASLPKTESPAYGENAALDSLHQQAMKGLSPEIQNDVNAVREISKKLGGRVYIMPDEASFVKVLDDLWSKQNGGKPVPPEISASHAASASHNGIFTAQILGPDGKPQNIAFVRDPAALAHEGIGHVLERTLPDEVNAAMDSAIRQSISPENWEAAGKYYTERFTGRAVENWREELVNSGIDIDPDTYLAREFRAENLDVAFRNRGEAFATAPDLYNRITGWLGTLAEKAGVDFGARSASLEFPTSIVEARRGERAARRIIESEPRQELIKARDERLREAAKPVIAEEPAPTPAPAPTTATEATTAKEWIDANPQKVVTPESANAGKAIADALTAGQPVRVSYWAAKGTPAGETISMRPERRAEIEAQRQADNADRQLVEHNFTPYRIEVRSTGPQFVGWSRDILNSNVTKFNEWLKTVDDKSRVPYETDANGLTGKGMVALQADIETYMANQAKGFTGSGEHLVVPEAARKLGAFAPEETAPPVPLDIAKADTINFLFGTRIPESAGRMAPLHLAGQEVSAATVPGRVEVPVRPRGEFSESMLKKAGITEPKGVREVNPFRQWVESQTGAKPSLVEVNQRLNLSRIEEAGPSVAEPMTGNVLTQAAGFQPGPLRGVAEEVGQLRDLKAEPPYIGFKGRYGNDMTGWAFELGASIKTPDELAALRSAQEMLSAAGKEAMAARDLDTAMKLMGRSQAAREAYEAATGRTMDGTKEAGAPFIRKHYDPNYQPPMGEIRGQSQPAKRPVDLTTAEKEKLTNEEMADMWPEIVIPEKGKKTIGSDIMKSPLYKQAATREEAVKLFADKLEGMANEWKDNPVYQAGVNWYKDIVPMLKEEFGADAPLFAELLAATSPQTNVGVNFGYAVEALKNFKAGKYDAMVKKFEEGIRKWDNGELRAEYEKDLSEGKVLNPPAKPTGPIKRSPTYLAHWIVKNDLVPRTPEGKRYGLHSFPVLKVFARRWLTESDAPKTLNFVQNLAGTGKEATIDIWADRTMRRLAYEGEPRWRIIPKHARGPTEAELKFSQEAFRQAAERLGVDPLDLQAALWFSEKQIWSDNGWTKLDLGDYRTEMKKYRAKKEAPALDISPRGE
jgi:hypothetical protein